MGRLGKRGSLLIRSHWRNWDFRCGIFQHSWAGRLSPQYVATVVDIVDSWCIGFRFVDDSDLYRIKMSKYEQYTLLNSGMLFVNRWSTCALSPLWSLKACQGRTWDGPGAEDLHGDRWHVRKGNLFCGKQTWQLWWNFAYGALCVVGNFACIESQVGWLWQMSGYKREQVGLFFFKGLVHCEPDIVNFYKFWFYKLLTSWRVVFWFSFQIKKIKISGDLLLLASPFRIAKGILVFMSGENRLCTPGSFRWHQWFSDLSVRIIKGMCQTYPNVGRKPLIEPTCASDVGIYSYWICNLHLRLCCLWLHKLLLSDYQNLNHIECLFCAIMRFSQLPMRWQRIGGCLPSAFCPTAYRRHSLRSSTFFPRAYWSIGMMASDHCSKKPDHNGSYPWGTGHACSRNRFSYVINLKGPSFIVNTACSASLVALHSAKTHLYHAGGVVSGVLPRLDCLLSESQNPSFSSSNVWSRHCQDPLDGCLVAGISSLPWNVQLRPGWNIPIISNKLRETLEVTNKMWESMQVSTFLLELGLATAKVGSYFAWKHWHELGIAWRCWMPFLSGEQVPCCPSGEDVSASMLRQMATAEGKVVQLQCWSWQVTLPAVGSGFSTALRWETVLC